ncbi:MAG TPA: hypothetical protein VK255_04285 [Patescibacteria group bacterium]|nr:hypothetical protein [Patescibacteria group bacterium]
MYIEHHNIKKKIKGDQNRPAEKQAKERNRKVNEFTTPKKEEKKIEPPRDYFIPEHSKDVLAHWKAPEYEVFERDRKWYFFVTIFLAGIVAWAIYTNSPVMAITFILIGIVGYLHINTNPRILDFMITTDGMVSGKEIYEFDDLESFWIFYEPEGLKSICLHNKSGLMPYIHIPIHQEDPVHIRQILLEFLPEEKKEPGLVETMERLLKI